MQGRIFIFTILAAGMSPTAALAGETVKRITCPKEQPQPFQFRQQQAQARERAKNQDCPVKRAIPPVVDPTPHFIL